MFKIKEVLKKYKYNKDGKTLVSNFSYLSLLQIANYIFPLITIPYLARVIGVDNFGKIAFSSAIIVWFQTISDWGFNYTATRDVAKNRDNVKQISLIFSNVLWSRVFLMFVSFALLNAIIILIPKFKEHYSLILITFLLIPGHIMFPDWFFQALERMKYITILSIISKLLFTVLVFIFIKEKSDFILQPLLNSIGFLISGLISLYVIVYKWKIKILKPKYKDIIKTINGSTNIFINNIMPNFYNSFSIMLLGIYGGSTSNGILDAGSKFVNISHQLINVFSRTFFPFLSRRIDKHYLYRRISLIVTVFFSIILFIASPILIKMFFTHEFYDAILISKIMSVSIIFLTINTIYGTNYMIIKGYDKQLRNITIICSILGFMISFPLIYFYDYIGAAITIALIRGLLSAFILRGVKTINNNEKLINKNKNAL